MHIKDFLIQLTAKGYCCFTFAEAKEALNVSDIAARAALRRLKQKGELAQPLAGFYVIVPPEYRVLGCRPADHFIHELMQYVNATYYAALLTAAQYYGASHHRPQQFQIIINQKRRPITCGRIKILFVTKKIISGVLTEKFNTSQGIIAVGSPEVTAMDMVTYPDRCGGIDNVLTVLTDLVKKLDAKKLFKLASNCDEITWVQRLGYLLDLIKANHLSDSLHNLLRKRRARTRFLITPAKKSPQKKLINDKWKLIINKKLELEND